MAMQEDIVEQYSDFSERGDKFFEALNREVIESGYKSGVVSRYLYEKLKDQDYLLSRFFRIVNKTLNDGDPDRMIDSLEVDFLGKMDDSLWGPPIFTPALPVPWPISSACRDSTAYVTCVPRAGMWACSVA